MKRLFDLPQDILWYTLQYLFLFELGNFDRSITNHMIRECYLKSIRGMEIPREYISHKSLTYEGKKWILSRGLLLRYIRLRTLDILDVDLIRHCQSILECLDFTKVRYFKMVSCYQFPYCPSLRIIRFNQCCRFSEEMLRLILSHNSHIVELDLRSQPELSDDFFTFLSNTLRCLQHLDLSGNVGMREAKVSRLASLPLRSIRLECTDADDTVIMKLLEICPSIQCIVFNPEMFAFRTILHYIRQVWFSFLQSDIAFVKLLGAKQLYQSFRFGKIHFYLF